MGAQHNNQQTKSSFFIDRHHHHIIIIIDNRYTMNTASPSSAESSASINTSTDRKLDSTKCLYALRDRLGDVNQILDDLCLLVRECCITRNDLLEKVSFVEAHVIEFIKTAMNDIHATAKAVAPNRHIKPEVRFVRGGHSLLVTPNTNTYYQCSHVNALDPTREGAYLYFDPNMDYFVRSGKVTRSGFIDRHQQHFKESTKSQTKSNFYYLYPSTTCSRWATLGRQEARLKVSSRL
jgi:hypothetical protein